MLSPRNHMKEQPVALIDPLTIELQFNTPKEPISSRFLLIVIF